MAAAPPAGQTGEQQFNSLYLQQTEAPVWPQKQLWPFGLFKTSVLAAVHVSGTGADVITRLQLVLGDIQWGE